MIRLRLYIIVAIVRHRLSQPATYGTVIASIALAEAAHHLLSHVR